MSDEILMHMLYHSSYVDSGASGSFSHPRMGTRKTRLLSSESSLSAAATTTPDDQIE